ncbi:MAG: fumarylacetoacetate hydrolase family protein [Aquiluna sp.]|nr:fumarylacetoacetate hydrolase family protein [Aquiluna sp.]
MQIVRVALDGEVHHGVISEGKVDFYDGDPILGAKLTGKSAPLSAVKLMAPVAPGKLICIGMNYAAHAAEIAQDVPDEPLVFFKPISSIIGPEDTIQLPHQSDQVELEIELAIVIGKKAKNVSVDQALDYVFGYTIGNDVTARDLQFSDLQWARSKAFDTFCPLGPWIETELDTSAIRLESRVNGQVRQKSKSSDMITDVPNIIAFVSQNFTLEPGDVILTGSPAGISKVEAGDQIECEISGIGILHNPVS